jgi:hypothetical protein
MHDKFQQQRIASYLEAATFGVESFQRDLAAAEALDKEEASWFFGRGPIAVTLTTLDAICRAKHSGLLTPEQVDGLSKLLPRVVQIARNSRRLAKLGFRLKPSVLKELEILDYDHKMDG